MLRQAGIPGRLADALAEEVGIRDQQTAQLKKSELELLVSRLTNYPLASTGHEGYPKVGSPLPVLDQSRDQDSAH